MMYIFLICAILYCYVDIPFVSSVGFIANSPKLGIDYGPRLIGIGISNKLGIVSPLLALPNHRNLTRISEEIAELVLSKQITDVILGIPLDSNGRLHYKVKNFNGRLCLDFSRVLSSVINQNCPKAKVYLVDERFSTREAKFRLSQDRIKASVDAMSAACLIERFIEDEGEYSIPAEPCDYPPPTELATLDYSKVSEHIRNLRSVDLTQDDINKMRMKELKVSSLSPFFLPFFFYSYHLTSYIKSYKSYSLDSKTISTWKNSNYFSELHMITIIKY